MNLKKYTDYALRVLIFTGAKRDGELASIKEISETFAISQDHLRKIVVQLNNLGLLETVRGRYGGIRLAKDPEEINVGMVVRQLENDFVLLECFDKASNYCVISPACKLKHALHEALQAFFRVLDGYTIKDLLTNDAELRQLMGLD
ncbi:Rrf2 family transcriptional regulator [Lentibacillus sp. L22]|uniref:Rrf2 family transcriptional regulator n=1 Tax=Lentibacillus TaxID=175304 RepID=UPI0022B1145A|nr:Rrf2 family transcriptional regulator [Lentibacillus daqui]